MTHSIAPSRLGGSVAGGPGAGSASEEAARRFQALDEQWLREGLARSHRRGHGHVGVGLVIGDRTFSASIDANGVVRPGSADTRRGPIGCVAKLFTGTLAMRAATEGRLDFARQISSLIRDDTPELRDLLGGVTLRQLLNHTSGLDASELDLIELTADARIDLNSLCDQTRCEQTSSRRLFEPGSLYSYGNASAWVAAAALEHVYDMPFSELLEQRVLQPAGIALTRAPQENWCPANGAHLRLSVTQLLQFCRWFLEQEDLRTHAELALVSRPPGWCLERGSCAGWKCFGDGWYGHNMALTEDSLIVRVNMQHRIALVVAASGVPASVTTVRLFGRLLPEYSSLQLPKPLEDDAEPGPHAARCSGTYDNREITVRVWSEPGVGMRATIVDKVHPRSAAVHTKLQAGTDDAWLAESSAGKFFQWVQFLPRGAATPSYLWDGTQVLHRTPTAP